MTQREQRTWLVGLQPVQGGQVFNLSFQWPGEPSMEDAATMARSQLPRTTDLVPTAPRGDLTPNQTELKARGYEIVSISEVLPLD